MWNTQENDYYWFRTEAGTQWYTRQWQTLLLFRDSGAGKPMASILYLSSIQTSDYRWEMKHWGPKDRARPAAQGHQVGISEEDPWLTLSCQTVS